MKKSDLRFATGDRVELPKRLTKQGGQHGTVVTSIATSFGESTTVAREVNGRIRHTVVKADELYRLSDAPKRRSKGTPSQETESDDPVLDAVRKLVDRAVSRDEATRTEVVARLTAMAAVSPGSTLAQHIDSALKELDWALTEREADV